MPVTGNKRKIKAYEIDKHSTSRWNINESLTLHFVQSPSIAPPHHSRHYIYSMLCLC